MSQFKDARPVFGSPRSGPTEPPRNRRSRCPTRRVRYHGEATPFPPSNATARRSRGHTRREGCRPGMSEARHWRVRGPCFGPSALFVSGESRYLALQARLVCFAPLALRRTHAPRPRSGEPVPSPVGSSPTMWMRHISRPALGTFPLGTQQADTAPRARNIPALAEGQGNRFSQNPIGLKAWHITSPGRSIPDMFRAFSPLCLWRIPLPGPSGQAGMFRAVGAPEDTCPASALGNPEREIV